MESSSSVPQVLFARYKVQERVPSRGNAELYRALNAETGRPVFVRCFQPTDGSTLEVLATMAKISRITSRFLVEVLEAGPTDDGRVFLAQPVCEGESLATRLERKKTLSVPESLLLFSRVLRALDALHRREVTHGNLRPTRVLLEQTSRGGWHVKVHSAAVCALTPAEQKQTLAVHRYVAPECRAGAAPDARADLWSTAAMFVESVAGAPSDVSADGYIAALEEAGRKTPKSLPQGLRTLFGTVLSDDPARRPADAKELLELLAEYLPRTSAESKEAADNWTRGVVVGRGKSEPRVATPLTQTTRRRNNARLVGVVAVTALASALLAGLGVVAFLRSRSAGVTVAPTAGPRTSAAPTADATASATAALSAVASATATATATATVIASAAPSADTVRPSARASSTRSDGSSHGGSGEALLVFQAAQPCSLVLDGELRGEVASTRIPVSIGTHALSCQTGDETVRLSVRVRAGHVTRVRVNSRGETEVDFEPLR